MIIKEQIIKIKGIDINYASGGTGDPMIFLSNGGGFWQIWEHQVNFFVKDYKIFAIDWPGCGKSQASNVPITLDYLYDILKSFIFALDLKNITLISACVGGAVSMQYAIKNQKNVKNIVVINICPGDKIIPNKIFRNIIKNLDLGSTSKKILSSTLKFLVTKTPWKRKFPRVLFGKHCNKSSSLYRKYKEKMTEKKQAFTRLELLLSAHTFNVEKYFIKKKQIKHILIWGGNNKVASLKKHGYYHYKLLQSTEFHIIKDGGHMCMYEKPIEVNDIIKKYLKSTSSSM